MSAAPVVLCAAAGDAPGVRAWQPRRSESHSRAPAAPARRRGARAGERRGPTLLAAEAARGLEAGLVESGLEASARGRLGWVAIGAGEGWQDRAATVVSVARSRAAPALLVLPAERWREALTDDALCASAVLLRADLPADGRCARSRSPRRERPGSR